MNMNVALIVRFIDQLSAPMEKAVEKVEKFKSGVGRAAIEFRRGFSDAVRPHFSGELFERNLEQLDRRVERTRARLLGGVAQAAALFGPIMRQADFQEAFIRFANVAEIPIERMGEIERRLIAQTGITGKNKAELLEIVEAYVGKGMDLDAAMAAIEATGRAATATSSNVADMSNAGFAVMSNLKIAPEELRKAFDIMAASGKEGSFELADMARKFPEITAGAQALQMEGVPAIASLSAALQVAMKSAGSADQAATNMTNFLGKITAPDTVKRFQKLGIDIEAEMKRAAANGSDPLLHSLRLIQDATGGDQFRMGELFADKQVLDFLRALLPNLEEYERIRQKAGSAEGVIDRDWINVTSGFKSQWRGLVTEIDNLFSSAGALLPIVQDLLATAILTVQAINEWTTANPELTATIVKITAALLAFGVASRVLAFAWALTGRQLFKVISLFYRFDKSGRSIAPLGGLVRGLGRGFGLLARSIGTAARGLSIFRSTFAALPGLARGALGRLGSILRAGAASGWVIPLAFEFLDDLGRTPEQRLEQMRRNHEAAVRFEKEFDQTGFGRWWQGLKDKSNELMGLEAGDVPADLMLAKLQKGWDRVQGFVADKQASFASAWSDLDLSGAAISALNSFLAGFDAAWAQVSAWVDDKAAWLKSAFTFDISMPSLPRWFGSEPKAEAPVDLNAGLKELGSIFNGFSQAGGAIEDSAGRAGDRLLSAGTDAGGSLGNAAVNALRSAAGSVGTTIGQTIAAEIRKASAAVKISVNAPAGQASGGRDIARAKAGALHDGVDE